MNNNEFKKSKNGQYTVYTLESATGGSTSAASMGSVSKPMGGVQRRGDNLITQEGDKDKIDASKPRNFVAKNAKMGGAGAHKDKKKEQKQGNEKHKKPYMEDHEVSMASNELKSIHSDAQKLLGLVQQYGENGDLQAWQQSKITKAADYLNSVLQSIGGEQGVAEGVEKTIWVKPSSNHTLIVVKSSSPDIEAGEEYDEGDLNNYANNFGYKIKEQGVAEAGPFSYGKPPRKGSVADLTAKKRKEQERGQQPIEPKDQQVGVAKVTKGVAEGSSKRDQQDVAAIRAAIARLEAQLNHPNADRDAIQQSIAHEKKRLALYGVTEAAYNPDTFVGKKGTYKGYGITQEGPRQWGISSSVRKFPTLDAAKRHIDKNLVAEGQTPEQEIERLKLRQNIEHGKAPLRRQAATQARIRELEKQIKDNQGVAEGPELKKVKREYNQAAKDAGGDWAGAGKKIDNMKKGLRQKDVDNKKEQGVAETDGYMEGLMQKLAEKIPASAPVDVWVQDFQKADPNKYHQFKNKTPAKKAQMAVAASYAAKNPNKKK